MNILWVLEGNDPNLKDICGLLQPVPPTANGKERYGCGGVSQESSAARLKRGLKGNCL